MTIILIALSIFGIVLIAYGLFSKPKESLAGKILPDMIPWEMAGINVRSRLPDDDWNELALYAKRRQGFKCEVCGGHGKEQGFNHAVEAHEIWQHDHATRTQKLLGIVVLCPLCHKFKHIAFADSKGYGRQVRAHIQKVNGWTADQVELAINRATHEVKQLRGKWKLDLTYLNDYPYKVRDRNKRPIVFTNQENRYCRKGVYE
ncbi:hypothetical protein [Burkholderia cenocepacia]|uniref:hypothetical protein n=1 Tax=Burkholderia cenocepacia TaxID=95486 RepID=UPI00098247F7|nr:hypothetical protein [Burkholderia cenocepacia]ONV40559.1 hypothetical protein A8E82_19575 [Burkholderia cenocepacia]ONV60135.1 hypothetical protein A8E76_14090 [Burkholderia cenocepacia]ONV66962.1 hypothetical protein A8E79_03625 [Burkholderia cenocepacia]ONW01631.1 hypothetical protein A8E86_17305 [Burkholderia cenocepacia]